MKRPFFAMSSPEALARDEATLVELGPHVADEFAFAHHHLGQPKGDTETAVIRRAEQAQETAVKARAEQEAERLPAVAPQITLTAAEVRGLISVLGNARMDVWGFQPPGRKHYSSPEVLDLASQDLSYRLGWAKSEANHATAKQREAHVQQAVDRYHQRRKAARTRRERQERERGERP